MPMRKGMDAGPTASERRCGGGEAQRQHIEVHDLGHRLRHRPPVGNQGIGGVARKSREDPGHVGGAGPLGMAHGVGGVAATSSGGPMATISPVGT